MAQISEMIDQGKIQKARNYCETYVLNAYLIYLRFMMQQDGIDLDGYNRCIKDVINVIETKHDDRPRLGHVLEA